MNTKKERNMIKKKLHASCRGILTELLEEVGFSDEERVVFYNRYVLSNPHSVPVICMMLPCSPSKYNDIHNNILDKVLSYFQHIK